MKIKISPKRFDVNFVVGILEIPVSTILSLALSISCWNSLIDTSQQSWMMQSEIPFVIISVIDISFYFILEFTRTMQRRRELISRTLSLLPRCYWINHLPDRHRERFFSRLLNKRTLSHCPPSSHTLVSDYRQTAIACWLLTTSFGLRHLRHR